MALEAKNINNATDMRNYVEGCLNDLVEGLSTVEETMVYMKEYTHRIIDLASASQKPDTSESALPISDVGKSCNHQYVPFGCGFDKVCKVCGIVAPVE
jgi:hypoxanthine-guanine phosphoribosyltransferase